MSQQLNKLKTQETGPLQVLCDGDLKASVMRLRFDIRDFALVWEEPEKCGLPPGKFWKYVIQTRPVSDDFQAYLASAEGIPAIIESFIWGLLMDEVFEQFLWAPAPCNSIAPVYRSLKHRR